MYNLCCQLCINLNNIIETFYKVFIWIYVNIQNSHAVVGVSMRMFITNGISHVQIHIFLSSFFYLYTSYYYNKTDYYKFVKHVHFNPLIRNQDFEMYIP